MQKFILLPLVALCFISAAQAQAQVRVKDAWVRATVTQQKVTGAFMQLNSAQDARLIEARSPVAATVELHQMEMVGNVMEMRAIPGLDLPAGKTVELSPGAYHIMLIGLKAQVREGDIIPISLVIEGRDKKRETIEVKAIAKPLHQANGHLMPVH
ncbi:MAG: copper chaperone PCu(A)C [Glaciimonas sp.]|nr:copper chaperone PCu(A)C [Glaciimonas sp.]